MQTCEYRLKGAWVVAFGYAMLLAGYGFFVIQALNDNAPRARLPFAITMIAIAATMLIAALVALRKGSKRAWWAVVVVSGSLLLYQLVTDPRCTTHILEQHGCHTFLISMATIMVGIVWCFLASKPAVQVQ